MTNVRRAPLVIKPMQLVREPVGMRPLCVRQEGSWQMYCEVDPMGEVMEYTVHMCGSDKFGRDVKGEYVDTICVDTDCKILHVYLERNYDVSAIEKSR